MNTALQPTGLLCNLLAHPERTTIRTPVPHFSWVVNDARPNAHQVGFRILVATSPDRLASDTGDMWDSGIPEPAKAWATDPQSVAVPYAGKPLSSNATYHWKVRTWNEPDAVSPWSELQAFKTGQLTDDHTTAGYVPEITSEESAAVVMVGSRHAFIDFGRAAFGTIELTIDSPEDAALEVHLGEVPDGPYGINRSPGGSRRYRCIPLQVRQGPHTYRLQIPQDERNTGPMAIRMPDELFEVYPFRYCEIIGCPTPLTKSAVRRLSIHYPFDENAASFTSSSATLSDVWEMCSYTMKATSFCGYYVDGDRERIPYEADAYINQLGHYGTDREYTLARRTHEYLIMHPTWPTEWHLYSVLMAWNDFMYSGDPASIARYYEDLRAKALTALAREDGLISSETGLLTEDVERSIHFAGTSAEQFSSGIRDIVDWPQVERDGYDMKPVKSLVNALHYRALLCMTEIAEALNKVDDASWYRRRAALVRSSFINSFVDETTGVVVDAEGSGHSSLHANVFALAAGLVPEQHIESAVDVVRCKGMACSVYVSQIVLEALYSARAGAEALALLAGTGERSWAHMIYDVGTTIALEAWDDRLKPNQDWNHAWGAAPAGMIPRGLMGIRPLAPGFAKIAVEPQPGALAWAEIRTPTVRGTILARFNNGPDGRFQLEVDLPANTETRVVLPRAGTASGAASGAETAVTVDGRRVFGVPVRGGIAVDGIGSGRHVLVAQ